MYIIRDLWAYIEPFTCLLLFLYTAVFLFVFEDGKSLDSH